MTDLRVLISTQVKAGVVQSSGIVSLSSVPFGQYEVKLTADIKGQPASGFVSPKQNPAPLINRIVLNIIQFRRYFTPTTRPAVAFACAFQIDPCLVSN